MAQTPKKPAAAAPTKTPAATTTKIAPSTTATTKIAAPSAAMLSAAASAEPAPPVAPAPLPQKVSRADQVRAQIAKYQAMSADFTANQAAACTNTDALGRPCGHVGSAHASVSLNPCTICGCGAFKHD